MALDHLICWEPPANVMGGGVYRMRMFSHGRSVASRRTTSRLDNRCVHPHVVDLKSGEPHGAAPDEPTDVLTEGVRMLAHAR